MGDWFLKIFSADGFLPRGACGDFQQDLLYLRLVVSNSVISVVFLTTALLLAYLAVRRGKDQAGWWLKIFFACVFATCAMTHMTQVVVWWWPAYRFFALVHDVAAVAAVICTLGLIVALPDILRSQRPVDMESELRSMRMKRVSDEEELQKLRDCAARYLGEETHDAATDC